MSEENDYSDAEHPFTVAAYELDDAFAGLGHDVLIPFAPPEDSHVLFDVWHQYELASRAESDAAVAHWIRQGVLPVASDSALFFLRHRFANFAEFLRKLVLEDGTTILEHPSVDSRDFMLWGLIDWWKSHGIREAYFSDLYLYEHE